LKVTVGSDSSQVPDQADIDRLINLALSEPQSIALIDLLKALSGNPYSATTGVAYGLTTRSIDIELDTYITRNHDNDYDEQMIISPENTMTTTSAVRQFSMWNVGLGVIAGVIIGFTLLSIRTCGGSDHKKLQQQSQKQKSLDKPKQNFDDDVMHNLEYYGG
jgi:hypothetical protein